MKTYYAESDGDAHARTFYVCARNRSFRIDCESMREARAVAAALNGTKPTIERTIQRAEFETAGWRVIELACGEVVFPDGSVSKFNVRLQAMPGEDGDIQLKAEDVNAPSSQTKVIKLKRLYE